MYSRLSSLVSISLVVTLVLVGCSDGLTSTNSSGEDALTEEEKFERQMQEKGIVETTTSGVADSKPSTKAAKGQCTTAGSSLTSSVQVQVCIDTSFVQEFGIQYKQVTIDSKAYPLAATAVYPPQYPTLTLTSRTYRGSTDGPFIYEPVYSPTGTPRIKSSPSSAASNGLVLVQDETVSGSFPTTQYQAQYPATETRTFSHTSSASGLVESRNVTF